MDLATVTPLIGFSSFNISVQYTSQHLIIAIGINDPLYTFLLAKSVLNHYPEAINSNSE